MATNLCRKKCVFIKMMRLGMSLLQHSRVTMAIGKKNCFKLTLKRKREHGQTKLDW
jgi:hypothetical protein